MGVIGDWRAARDRRRLSAAFLQAVLSPTDPADAEWLTTVAGSRVAAERELLFARRALALIAAQRDALDDRTASDVARELGAVTDAESRHDAALSASWPARWRGYADALAVRGGTEPPATRLARVLLAGAGLSSPTAEQLGRATHSIQTMRARANESLRAVFGVASLPDDVRPSAWRS